MQNWMASLFAAFVAMNSVMAELKVATLHPVLTDLARQVGGEHVTVVPLLKVGQDPHDFSPSASDIRKMASAKLILASGKGLEPYLTKLGDSLTESQEILDVGKGVPGIVITEDSKLFVCCPHHSVGSVDPHWWHSVKNVQRAAKIIAKAFGSEDPANKSTYKANAKAYDKQLQELYQWSRKEIARVPRSDRKLATAHAAYTYFCQEFGFQSMPVQGLDKESEATSQYLADVIEEIKHHSVKAVFPESQANPKVLKEMVRGTGAKIGGSLFADFTGSPKAPTYEAMLRHNVKTIVAALAPKSQ